MKDALLVVVALSLAVTIDLPAQSDLPNAEDVASPEAIVAAGYAALARAPGEPFDWDRFRSLFLPDARMIPSTEQRGGEFSVLTVEEFIDWIDGWAAENDPIGGPNDQGFVEEQVAVDIEVYGDIAQAFSTYQKHIWESDEIQGRGINSFNLVKNSGRWWIASVAWDEEVGAGPVPDEYLP